MKKITYFLFIFVATSLQAQTDFSDRWEDFFSYNNVKDFIEVDQTIYAIADNAVFTYNIQTNETKKLSSVQGLSGETTSAIHYNETFKRLVIGYENGLIEVVDEDGRITISVDIVNFNQSGEKKINHIYEHNNKLYLATPFAVVVYDIEKLEFGDTYFIGNNSSDVFVNQITVLNDTLFAATNTGVFTANVNDPNLIDFNSWTLSSAGSFQKITQFNNTIYTVKEGILTEVNGNPIIEVFLENIIDLKSNNTYLTIALSKKALFYNTSLVKVGESTTITDFDFNLNTALATDTHLFLGTKEFGVLTADIINLQVFEEVHPDGPLNNSPFSITAKNDNLWVVYGGYDTTFTPSSIRQGYSHFINDEWKNTRFNVASPFTDLNHITIDPNDDQHVFISSMGSTENALSVATGGLLEIKNDEVVDFYNQNNSGLEGIPGQGATVTIRVTGTIFDRDGNLWATNIGVDNRLKKWASSGQWTGFELNSLYVNNAFGMSEIVQDRTNSFWIGTRRNGAYVFNENGKQKKALTTELTKGSLPNLNVRTIAVDKNGRIWIGTLTGMVVFNSASTLFKDDVYDAEAVIILDDGIPKKLLGEQTVNSIVVDGGDNKWFGTENAGALYTNPNGQNTLANFNKDNSPLPSNKILKISVDQTTGKVYFATDKGIVAYNSKIVPFGNELGSVYAYPNPVLKAHDFVTIDGRNGTHLPKGTNVKILDVAGNLVYETNVVEGQQLEGGKVVWNKKNLAGTKVASGIYIVLLANDDASETATAKIAIIN